MSQSVSGINKLIDENDKIEKILENLQLLVQPIVKNWKKATFVYKLDVWKEWE